MRIDLIEIAKSDSRDTISGRPTGSAARERFNLTDFHASPANQIDIYVPDHVRVVTPSFFIGLLGGSIGEGVSLDEAQNLVHLHNESDTTSLNLKHALTTMLRKKSLFSNVSKPTLKEKLFGTRDSSKS